MTYSDTSYTARICCFLLFVVIFFQNLTGNAQAYQECTSESHPIFSAWNLPDSVCAGSTTILHIGYDASNDIVLTPSAASTPNITSPETMFIPDGVNICGCVNSSIITFSGYSGNITDVNQIKYVKLNMEHSRASDLFIRLRCPDGSSVVILNCGFAATDEDYGCASEIPPSSINWQNDPEIVEDDNYFGNPNRRYNMNDDDCDPNATDNGPGFGNDYCWSNNDSPNYIYAGGDNSLIHNSVNLNEGLFIPTSIINEDEIQQLYKPDEPFDALIGCPLNGDWTIEIVDGNPGDNGYLFNWEIKFDSVFLASNIASGSGIDSIAVVPNSGDQADSNFTCNFNGDSIIVFHAPSNITANTTITETLRLFNSSDTCYKDTTISIVVLAPIVTVHHDTICEGESTTLTVNCSEMAKNILFNEGFSQITSGNDYKNTGSSNYPYNRSLPNIPSLTGKVYQAGGHLRIGKSDESGSITSKAMDLSSPYTIRLWLRGWNLASEDPQFHLDVDGTTVMSQSIPVSAWNSPYTEYSYNSVTAATTNSTITIGNSGAHQRFFIDSVVVMRLVSCQFDWSTGETGGSITVSPAVNTGYSVTITPSEGCPRIDSFYVVVRSKPTVTLDPCGGTCGTTSLQMNCQDGVTLPPATPCATGYNFAGWSSEAVDPSTPTVPTPLYQADENFRSLNDTTLFAVYTKEGEYWSYPFYPSASATTSACESYTWHRMGASDTTIYESGTYFHRHTDANGCVYVDTLKVTVNPTYNVTDRDTICDSQLPYTWNGVEFNSEGTQTATLETVNGCDSVVVMTLTVNPTYNVTDRDTICDSQLPYTWNGVEFNSEGTQTATLETVNGCDSVVVMTLTVNPTYSFKDTATICQNELPYTWRDTTFLTETTSSDYVFHRNSINGCDSVVTLHLTINPSYNITLNPTICENASYTFLDTTVSEAGTYTRTGQTIHGCDSTVTVNLSVSSEYRDTLPKHICQYDSYDFNDTLRTETGFYVQKDTAQNGCDSVTVLHLIVHELDTSRFDRTICLGSAFQEFGFDTIPTTAGIHTLSRTIPTQQYHCDSTIIVTLTVRDAVTIATTTLSVYPSIGETIVSALFSNVESNHSSVVWSINGNSVTHTDVITSSNNADTYTIEIPQHLCNDSLFYTIEYSDGICSATDTNYIHIVDTIKPVITDTLPKLTLSGCNTDVIPAAYNSTASIHALEDISIEDNCTQLNNLILIHSDSIISSTCDLSVLRTYTITDACGNSSALYQSILINRPSSFTTSEVDTAKTVYCETMASADSIILPTVKDACDSTLLPSGEPTVNTQISNCTGTKTYTYTYQNCAGADTTWTFTYHVALPELIASVPADRSSTVACLVDVVRPAADTITDVCGNNIIPEFVDSTATINPDNTGSVVFQYRYTDCAGNDSIWTYTYTLNPGGFIPTDNDTTTVHCLSEILPPILPTITNCGAAVTLNPGTNTSTLSNGCGDSTFVYTYTVNDTNYIWKYTYVVTPDTFTVPHDTTITVQCISGVTHPTPPIIINSCSDIITPTELAVDSSFNGCSGQVIYSWIYSDCNNHSHTWRFTYLIEDTIKPAFTVPSDISICRHLDESFNADTSITGKPTYLSDNCQIADNLTITYTDIVTSHITSQDTIIRTWRVADQCNDSVQTQRIFINPVLRMNLTDQICAGKLYDHYGFNYIATRDTTLKDTTFSVTTMCDSITVLHLTVSDFLRDTLYETICHGGMYIFGNDTLTANGTYRDTLRNAGGCDSITLLHLTVSDYITETVYDTVCHGGLFVFGGDTLTRSDIYYDTVKTALGCDSVTVLHLTVSDYITETVYDTVCHGGLFLFGGDTLTASDIYYDTVRTSLGCDSVTILHLTVSDYITETVYDTVCHGGLFLFGGDTLTASDIYYDTIRTSLGCDSVTILHLTVSDYITETVYDTICHGGLYIFGRDTLNANGTYRDTIRTAGGCDSITLLQLTVSDYIRETIFDTICHGSLYIFGSDTLTANGTYCDTTRTIGGCDSIIIIHLTVYHDTATSWNYTACDSFAWNNQTYNSSGDYVQHLNTIHGCDSIVTLHLTINHSSASEFEIVECESYGWNDTIYTESGDYTQTFTNAAGCDSTVTIHLTINNPEHQTLTIAECESYTWQWPGGGDTTITASGLYLHRHEDNNHCTQVDTLHLTINIPVHTAITDYFCQPYLWNGHYYSLPGNYTFAHDDANGCEQVDTLHLNFVDTTTTLFSHTFNFCTENYAVLEVTSTLPNILWSTGETNSVITVYETGLYTVTASQGQCAVSRNYYIQPCEYDILLPNAFTPNGDGTNDVFCIHEGYLDQIDDNNFEVRIYDRWGELVYVNHDKNFSWNGEIKGRVLHNYIYTYLIQYTSASGIPNMIKGSVIVR